MSASIATATAMITYSLCRFVIGAGPLALAEDVSLISERFDGVEERGLPRGIISEEHADGDREERGQHDGFERELHRPAERAADDGAHDAEQHTADATHEAEHHRLRQELELDGALRRADRHADADLARALGDRDEHHVHDPDASDDERDGAGSQLDER